MRATDAYLASNTSAATPQFNLGGGLYGFDVTGGANAAPAAPTLGSVVSGALASSTIYVETTYIANGGHQTAASPVVSATVSSGHLLVVSSPPIEGGEVDYGVYAGTASNTLTLQGSQTIGSAWTEPATGLTSSGASPPSSGAFATSIEKLAGDQETLVTAATVSGSGYASVYLPAGAYEIVPDGGVVYAGIKRIPGE